MGLTRVHNTSDMVESRHYCIVVPTCPYPSGVKTGELVHTRQSQDGVWWRYIEGRFYDRTTTPECSEDRTAVPTMVKMESELYTRGTTFHTHIFERLQSWVTKPINTVHYLRKYRIFFFFFVQNSSIGQQLSQHSQHHTPSMELHYTNSCQQLSAHIYSTHVLNFRVGPKAPQPFIYPFVYQPTYMHNIRAHLCMRPSKQGEWGG